MTCIAVQGVWKIDLVASVWFRKIEKVNLGKRWCNWKITKKLWSFEISIIKKVRRARKRTLQTARTAALHNNAKQATTLKPHKGE